MYRHLARLGAVVTALALAFASGATAQANDDEVIKRGACSGTAHWKLKAKPDDGRLEVEGEVDSNRVGQVWRWKLKHDGVISDRGRRTTLAPSGSFDVERRIVDARGADHIVFKAVNVRTGESCRGSLTI
jgi:hypothetical protein